MGCDDDGSGGQDRLNTAAAQVEAAGQQVLAIPADVGDAEQVRNLVKKSIGTFGKIDALVNNAGICLTGPMTRTSLEDWHQILDTNLWGCIHTIQAALPSMLVRSQGSIVNIGSFGGKMPLPQMTAYCTSKYAITGLTESLRVELSSKGIHVGIGHPGIIDSDFLERAMFCGEDEKAAGENEQRMTKALQSGIASQPEDIAEAVWKMVEKKQSETVVGVVAIATELNHLFPQLTQWALAKTVDS